jgi:C4-dicarboxylate-specific signal transduction histidine kinase
LLDRAGAEALRAGAIVGHLRAFVQRAEPHFESTDLGEVVRAATRWLSHELEHERITLHLELDVQPLPVRVDRIQIEQVLVNLMQNAVDAICEANTPTRKIWLRTSLSADGTAEVAVDDTGAGVTAAAADRLYEPFFTTKTDGMGMGLAICRTIAEMHQGSIAVEPRVAGPGTSARLVLPLEGSI